MNRPILLLLLLLGTPLAAQGLQSGAALLAQQGRDFRAEYTVEVKDTAARLFHVTATFGNLRQRRLELALPVWTPGWYTIENYGKNVLRFGVKDGSGNRLPAPRVQPQTWSIDTRGKDRITVEFDYLANVVALNQAKITHEYAFFTGTQLFLEPVGHRDAQATVRIVVPAGWKIVSALEATSDSTVFRARDYDALVDAPTLLGSIQVVPFEVEGKPHLFAIAPAGSVAGDIQDYATKVAAVIRVQSALFGGLPYDKYIIFYLSHPAESNAGGALEHLNSYVGVGIEGVGGLPWGAAHEIFHAWNVKRIRPAEMWPYDYARANVTPSLWLSEGITTYYAALTLHRAGLLADSAFLQNLAGAMGGIESNEARHYFSPSDASVATWLGYDDPAAFSISYYTQGNLLGGLLDLSIRQDTRGQRGLDDVMRVLYRGYYQKGKGFTPDDVVQTVSRVAGRDYGTFFRRFVTGVEVAPYDSMLAFAGYRTERSEVTLGYLGAFSWLYPEGRRVFGTYPGSPAALAGIKKDDLITAVDGVPVAQAGLEGGAVHIPDKAGQRMVLTLKRSDKEEQVPLTLGSYHQVRFRIVSDPAPTAQQLAVRRAWLSGVPAVGAGSQ